MFLETYFVTDIQVTGLCFYTTVLQNIYRFLYKKFRSCKIYDFKPFNVLRLTNFYNPFVAGIPSLTAIGVEILICLQ